LREALEQHNREIMDQKNKNSEIAKFLEAEVLSSEGKPLYNVLNFGGFRTRF
jgi:hypothetical protein